MLSAAFLIWPKIRWADLPMIKLYQIEPTEAKNQQLYSHLHLKIIWKTCSQSWSQVAQQSKPSWSPGIVRWDWYPSFEISSGSTDDSQMWCLLNWSEFQLKIDQHVLQKASRCYLMVPDSTLMKFKSIRKLLLVFILDNRLFFFLLNIDTLDKNW